MDRLKVRLFIGMFHLTIISTFMGCLMVPNLVYVAELFLFTVSYSIQRATSVDNYSWAGMVVGNCIVLALCALFLICHFCLILLKMGAFDKCIDGHGGDSEEESIIAQIWDKYPIWLLALKVGFLGVLEGLLAVIC